MLVSRSSQLIRLLKCSPISARVSNELHSSSRLNMEPKAARIKKLQEMFQVDDGLPVHLKRGTIDNVVYGSIITLCVLGLGYSLNVLYTLAYPTKKQ